MLRPYQEEAKTAILNQWASGVQRTLLVLPTGCGKTVVFAAVAKELVKQGKRVLILAHRGELLEQAADKIKTFTGLNCSVEKAEQSSIGTWERITVGSVQTLQNEKRIGKFNPMRFDVIIVDEAHHALSDSYQKIFDYFRTAKVLGVTATPDRGDMRNLGQFFQSLAYEYTLPKAIKAGYLCKIKAQTIPVNLDMRGVSTHAGDYRAADIGSVLEPYLEAIADEMTGICQNRKTVVFLPLIDTSMKFTKMLNARGFNAAEVNGGSTDRAEKLQDFANGKYNVLCNSMLLTEGWDCPSVDCIVVLRPTKIRGLYTQMVGRGTRLYPCKDHLLILDFLWHTSRHELCRPTCLICDSPEVAEKMAGKLEQQTDEAEDIEVLAEEAASDVIADREAALAAELEAQRGRKRALVDPLQFEMSIQAEDLAGYIPTFPAEMGPPSPQQLAMLEKRGIFPDEIENAGKASLIIDRLIKRQKEGLSTPKQIRLLERMGFRHVGEWSFAAASSMIGRISMNKWHIPRGIEAASYVPTEEADEERTMLSM